LEAVAFAGLKSLWCTIRLGVLLYPSPCWRRALEDNLSHRALCFSPTVVNHRTSAAAWRLRASHSRNVTFFFFVFLGPDLGHMEVPTGGVELEL